jgi:hypothetical protein
MLKIQAELNLVQQMITNRQRGQGHEYFKCRCLRCSRVSDDAALDLLLTKISINGKTLRNQPGRSFQAPMQIFHRKN